MTVRFSQLAKSSFLAILPMVLLLGVSAQANVSGKSLNTINSPKSLEYDDLIEVQVRMLDEIDLRIGLHKVEIRKKSFAFHRLKQKPAQGPAYLWMGDGEDKEVKKEKSLKLLGLGLKESVRELDLLESRRIEAQAELEWIKIQQDEFLKQKPISELDLKKKFKCERLPVFVSKSAAQNTAEKLELIQGFGLQKDAETELEWNSLGWWLSAAHEKVVACAPATVVFVGEIAGRGRVVMLDHGAGHLTVYANLNPSTLRTLKKGQKIKAGKSLGMSLDRLYFEYRRQGVAANPQKILRAESLAKVAL